MPNIEDLINNVVDQNFNDAAVTFNDIMNSKIYDSLEQEKVAVANSIYNEADEEQLELDLDSDDFSDEEVEEALEGEDED